MTMQNSRIRSTSVAILVCLLFVIVSAHVAFTREGNANTGLGTPLLLPGTPLKGVDVKLGKNPGGTACARTSTDDKGHFTLPVVPAGSYSLTIGFPEDTATSAAASARAGHDMQRSVIQNMKAREANPAFADLKACLITINGALGGTRTTGWNFETGKAFNPTKAEAAKLSLAEEKILIDSNGHDPFTGIVEATVVKSKSNSPE
jgi:carboxypeptidase family protein